MKLAAQLLTAALSLTSPLLAQEQPCYGRDGGITNEGPDAAGLAYLSKRFELVCHTREPEKGLRTLTLFTEPDLKMAVKDAPQVVYADMIVDRLVEVDGKQFLGGSIVTTSRCPLVQFSVPDAHGTMKHFDYWYMLATDLECKLKQPGEE